MTLKLPLKEKKLKVHFDCTKFYQQDGLCSNITLILILKSSKVIFTTLRTETQDGGYCACIVPSMIRYERSERYEMLC